MDMFTKRAAVWSPETPALYRYRLDIIWDPSRPMLVALMLNPSTADEFKNDPTVGRVEKRARSLQLGGAIILNAFAWRDTKPAKMKAAVDPIGPENDRHIRAVLRQGASEGWTFMVGWGNHGSHLGRDAEIRRMFEEVQIQPMCLSINNSGQPQHPLYCADNAPLIPWRIR